MTFRLFQWSLQVFLSLTEGTNSLHVWLWDEIHLLLMPRLRIDMVGLYRWCPYLLHTPPVNRSTVGQLPCLYGYKIKVNTETWVTYMNACLCWVHIHTFVQSHNPLFNVNVAAWRFPHVALSRCEGGEGLQDRKHRQKRSAQKQLILLNSQGNKKTHVILKLDPRTQTC